LFSAQLLKENHIKVPILLFDLRDSMAKLTATTDEIAELINSFSDSIQADMCDGKMVISKGETFSLTVGDINLKNFKCSSTKIKDINILLTEAEISGSQFSSDIILKRV